VTPSSKPKESGSTTPKPSGSPKPKGASEGTDEAKNGSASEKNHGEGSGSAKSDKHQQTGSGNGEGQEHGTASGNGEADIGLYAEIIKNRFQTAWNQPHGEIPAGTTIVVNVRLKIQPDGSVTEFSIVDGSGNAVVDDSVREAGKKITKLPPPPGGDTFTPIIRFELGD
jgi:TonB family protein